MATCCARTRRQRRVNPTDRGQSTVLAVGVVAVAITFALGLAHVGQALLLSARNHTAADAVALAAATEPNNVEDLTDWYRDRGIDVWLDGDTVVAGSGDTSARARALVEPVDVVRAPVLVAIVARVEQLIGHTLDSADIDINTVEFDADDGFRFSTVASEFGLCPQSLAGEPTRQVRFTWC